MFSFFSYGEIFLPKRAMAQSPPPPLNTPMIYTLLYRSWDPEVICSNLDLREIDFPCWVGYILCDRLWVMMCISFSVLVIFNPWPLHETVCIKTIRSYGTT